MKKKTLLFFVQEIQRKRNKKKETNEKKSTRDKES